MDGSPWTNVMLLSATPSRSSSGKTTTPALAPAGMPPVVPEGGDVGGGGWVDAGVRRTVRARLGGASSNGGSGQCGQNEKEETRDRCVFQRRASLFSLDRCAAAGRAGSWSISCPKALGTR